MIRGQRQQSQWIWKTPKLITTEEVLAEFLTGVAGFGDRTRLLACELVRTILALREIDVLPQSHESFQGGD
jgi:hypothetical protein